ncbi:MAG TPA: hypothetical protein VFZ58_05300 [Candidatus Saccharimonadales bacterium]
MYEIRAKLEAAFATEGTVRFYVCFFQVIEAVGAGCARASDLLYLRNLMQTIDRALIKRGERPLTLAELDDLCVVLGDSSSVQPIYLSAEQRDIAEHLVAKGVLELISSRIIHHEDDTNTNASLYRIPWSEYVHTLRTRWSLMRAWLH